MFNISFPKKSTINSLPINTFHGEIVYYYNKRLFEKFSLLFWVKFTFYYSF